MTQTTAHGSLGDGRAVRRQLRQHPAQRLGPRSVRRRDGQRREGATRCGFVLLSKVPHLYASFTKRFGASISETTMRTNPIREGGTLRWGGVRPRGPRRCGRYAEGYIRLSLCSTSQQPLYTRFTIVFSSVFLK